MSILIDSAIISEVEEVARWGWVKSVTTNPTLLAKSESSPEETLLKLAELMPGQIFYQLKAETEDLMIKEAKAVKALLGKQLVLKIPATKKGFKVVSVLSSTIPCAVTALFSPAQALVAKAAGAQYIIIYYNRSLRLIKDGELFIRNSIEILKGSNVSVLGASLKSPEEIVSAKLLGIEYLTVPYSVLKQMPYSDISEKTVKDFNSTGAGINIS